MNKIQAIRFYISHSGKTCVRFIRPYKNMRYRFGAYQLKSFRQRIFFEELILKLMKNEDYYFCPYLDDYYPDNGVVIEFKRVLL